VSIRTRLAIAVALVLMVTISLLGTALVRSTRATLIDQIDAQVIANADRGKGDPSVDDSNSNHPGTDPTPGGAGYGKSGTQDDPGGWVKAQVDDGSSSGGDIEYIAADATQSQLFASTDVYERSVASYRYGATGEMIDGKPCGFLDAPKPAPRVPEIPSDELNLLVNRIVTTPSVDGTLSYRMLVQKSASGETMVTAAPLDGVDAAIDRLVRILVIAGTFAMVAATATCWWLIRRGMRPVDRMVDTAAAIAAGDLSRRVPDADPRTELGRLGGALNEMLGQIESALDARTETELKLRRFVTDAAHELRTPLTSLRGYAELYRQGALRDETGVTNAMGRIEAEGARMSRLVDDLLLLARMDQQQVLEAKPVDLGTLVEEAASDFRAVDPKRPLTVNVSGNAVVAGDRNRLRQVIDNLLVNARLHTPAGTPVHLSVQQKEGQVEIGVADDGPGISPEDQLRVFERFWRADPARARKTGGSGLGLAIVASLVEAHGGRVTIDSAPGKGAKFTVRLPAVKP